MDMRDMDDMWIWEYGDTGIWGYGKTMIWKNGEKGDTGISCGDLVIW